MIHALPTLDDSFFERAPFVATASIDLPHAPAQVWSALGSDAMGTWVRFVDRSVWRSSRPLQVGCRRSVRIARLVTLEEEFYRWDAARRATFRVVGISHRVVSGWAEDFVVDETAAGGTRLTWTMAIDNSLLRVVGLPRFARRPVTALCRRLMRGIESILPAPHG